MRKEFIDEEDKIITSCPECGNQSAFYLINLHNIRSGFQVQYCDNCNNPYIVELETELTCKTRTYKCIEVKEIEEDK